MQKSTFHLTNHELTLIEDDQFLPAKRKLVNRLEHMLQGLGEDLLQTAQVKRFLRLAEAPASCKVTKGENYRELPYLVLDIPRLSSDKDLNALRIVIWWGRYATVNLLLSGKLLQGREEMLWAGAGEGLFYNNEDLWENELESAAYSKAPGQVGPGNGFMRVAVRVGFDRLDTLEAEACRLLDRIV